MRISVRNSNNKIKREKKLKIENSSEQHRREIFRRRDNITRYRSNTSNTFWQIKVRDKYERNFTEPNGKYREKRIVGCTVTFQVIFILPKNVLFKDHRSETMKRKRGIEAHKEKVEEQGLEKEKTYFLEKKPSNFSFDIRIYSEVKAQIFQVFSWWGFRWTWTQLIFNKCQKSYYLDKILDRKSVV